MPESGKDHPDSLSELLEQEGVDRDRLNTVLTTVHPIDLADVLEDIDLDDRVRIFEMLDPERAAQVLTAMSEEGRTALARKLGEERLADVVDHMPDFAVADIMDDLPSHKEKTVLSKMEEEEHAANVQQLLQYPEQTAGGRMTKNFVTVPESFTAGQTIQKIQGSVDSHTVDFIYVVDDQGALKGVSSLPKLMIHKPETPVTEFMRRDVTFVGPTMDQEELAKLAQKYRLRAVPVLDTGMKLLGVVTLQDIVDVIRSEADEDIMRLSGAERVDPIRAPFFRRLQARLPWLGAAMILELLIAWIMKAYGATLDTLALAYFIPVIMAMGGSLGLQSSTLVVRGLATGDITPTRALRIVGNEFWVGLAIGLMAGLVTGTMAYLMEIKTPNATSLGFIVFLSMIISLTVASTMGALTPLLLQRMKFDPAVASGPFITAMNDVVNVTIYLSMASFLIVKSTPS